MGTQTVEQSAVATYTCLTGSGLYLVVLALYLASHKHTQQKNELTAM